MKRRRRFDYDTHYGYLPNLMAKVDAKALEGWRLHTLVKMGEDRYCIVLELDLDEDLVA
jgi:hypothetical protein